MRAHPNRTHEPELKIEVRSFEDIRPSGHKLGFKLQAAGRGTWPSHWVPYVKTLHICVKLISKIDGGENHTKERYYEIYKTAHHGWYPCENEREENRVS